MTGSRDIPALTALSVTLLLLAGSLAAYLNRPAARAAKADFSNIRCVIALGRQDDTTRGLITGYNYHLLKEFEKDTGGEFDISLSNDMEALVDSIDKGSVDMAVVPSSVRIRNDNVISSKVIDSLNVWLMPSSQKRRMEEANRWITLYHLSDEYGKTRKLFLANYDPIKAAAAGRKRKSLSPYDHIIKEYADSIGWDWRMLAAVIYQESRFRIDARSHRGALGLMQITPSTAGHIGAGDLLDPSENIRNGASYLQSLSRLYRNTAADRDELAKFTLAAYNAGAGRMADVMNYAASRNADCSRWDSVVVIIPEMNDTLAMMESEVVKLGTFKGKETTAYVKRVFDLYEAFKKIDAGR